MSAPAPSFVALRRVGGFDLRVEWDDAALTGPVEETLGYFGLDPTAPPDAPAITVRYSTRAAPLAVPEHAEPLSESTDGLQFLRHAGSLYLRFRDAVVRVDPERGSAFGTPSSEGGPLRDAVLYSSLFYGVVALLAHRGVRTMHGAALDRDGHGCLVAGESDSGKSTLTMRLVEHGWGYLTDDSVLLRRGADGVEARPLRQDFCLDPEAEALFPQVAGHWGPHLADPRKRRLRVRSLYPGGAATRSTPRSVLFPRIVPEGGSRLVPLSRGATLLGLLRHTGAPGLADAPSARSHLDDLQALAGQVRGYALLAGRDLRDDPRAAAALTRALLTGNPGG